MTTHNVYPLAKWRGMRDGYVGTRPENEHTMGARLRDYVLPKLPDIRTLAMTKHVLVRPARTLLQLRVTSKPETKKFNRYRPAFEQKRNGELEVLVPPGEDYLYHYAALFASGLEIAGGSADTHFELPPQSLREEFIDTRLPALIPSVDVLVVGYVEGLFVGESMLWQCELGFGIRLVEFGTKSIGLLGCEFSFWGDIAGALIRGLAARNVSYIIYVGKAGAVSRLHLPNLTIATGSVSSIEGETVEWNSRIQAAMQSERVFIGQRHATLPSPMDETIAWYEDALDKVDLLEAEIGHMAQAARLTGIEFDYLHIISDNLGNNKIVGLYEERGAEVLDARRECLIIIEDIIKRSI